VTTLNYSRESISPVFVNVIVLVFCAAVVAEVSLAASAPVRVGYPQPSGAMLPLWLVTEAKLDLKYGVPVQNIFISGAARMNQSMVAGDIDLASIGGAVVNTVLAGGDLVAIAVGVPTYGFSLYAKPDVKDIAGLHGKVVGIMSKGASSEHAVIALLQRNHMQPGKDVKFIYLGGVRECWRPLIGASFPPACCRRRPLWRRVAWVKRS
jgi:ABC-type nitrate/sulfonate/bicarbonate transport system substrate-binding protein